METKTVNVPAIGCNGCVANIKNSLTEVDGIVKVDGDVATKTITVQWQNPATWQKIVQVMTEIEYPPVEA